MTGEKKSNEKCGEPTRKGREKMDSHLFIAELVERKKEKKKHIFFLFCDLCPVLIILG